MNKDILENIFRNLPNEQPSNNFRGNLMQAIEEEAIKMEKKEARWTLFSIITTSIGLIIIAILACVYVMGETGIQRFFSAFQINNQLALSDFKFPVLIGIIALVLLFADYWLRQRYTPITATIKE